MHAVERSRYDIICPLPVPHRLAVFEIFPAGGADPALPLIVLAHGMTRNAGDFDSPAEALARSGYRCLTADMPGRGESDDLPDPALYHYGVYCADMTHVLRERGGCGCVFIGTSMGGIMGMMTAAADRALPPDQMLIAGLILNDIGCFIPAAGLRRVIEAAENYPVFQTEQEACTHFAQKLAPFAMDPAYEAHLRGRAFRRDGGQLRYAYDPAITHNLRAAFPQGEVTDADLRDLWTAVDCPTYVIRGAKSDLLLETTLNEMRAHPKFCGALTVPGAGHAPMLETPEQQRVLQQMISGTYKERQENAVCAYPPF